MIASCRRIVLASLLGTLTAVAPTRYPNRRGPFQYALVFAGLGDKDHTIEQLQKMADVGPVRIGFTLNSPEFAFLRDDPRVKALRQQVGLPEYRHQH